MQRINLNSVITTAKKTKNQAATNTYSKGHYECKKWTHCIVVFLLPTLLLEAVLTGCCILECVSRQSLCAATEIPLMPLRTASVLFTSKTSTQFTSTNTYVASTGAAAFWTICIRLPPISSSFAHEGFCDTCSLISRQAWWLDCNPEWVKPSNTNLNTNHSFNPSTTKLMWNLSLHSGKWDQHAWAK